MGRVAIGNGHSPQTLIVPESRLETILVPSGEKSTLMTAEPVSVDPISFRDAVKDRGAQDASVLAKER